MNKLFQYKFLLASVIIIMFVIAIIGALFKIMHWPGANEMLLLSFFGALIVLGLTLYDMVVSPIRKKAIWIVTLFFAPLLVGLLYTFLRDDMLDRQEV
jgi:hypothetical protein